MPGTVLDVGLRMAADADTILVVEPSWWRGAPVLAFSACALALFPLPRSQIHSGEAAQFEQEHKWRKWREGKRDQTFPEGLMCAKHFVQCTVDALSWVLYDGSLSTGRASRLSDPLI